MRTISGKQVERGMTIGGLLRHGTVLLAEAGIDNAEQETRWLLESALQMDRLQLALGESRILNDDTLHRAESLLARRADREPLQYLLGTQEFCGLQFEVEPGVLIPRPETELLVEEALRAVRGQDAPVIADIGTGSGCLAVTLATILPTAKVIAIDCSGDALRVARRNAMQHDVASRIEFEQGDLFEPLCAKGLHGRLSVIVSNPPYIAEGEWETLQPEVQRFEPKIALVGGRDGLDYHRRLVEQAAEFLQPGGCLIMEVGIGQAARLRQRIGGDRKYSEAWTLCDAAGIERIVAARRV